jgi:hypothetical protein
MTTPIASDSADATAVAESTPTDLDKSLEGGNAKSGSSRKPKVPFFDADPDDIVPGYTDSDSWYEP